jgi:hypothetical protein
VLVRDITLHILTKDSISSLALTQFVFACWIWDITFYKFVLADSDAYVNRREQNVPIPSDGDSVYRPIERSERRFNPLKVPTSLQAKLPFAAKPKQMSQQGKKKKQVSFCFVWWVSGVYLGR